MILSVQNAITGIDTALHWTRNFADKLNDIHENCYLTNIDETTFCILVLDMIWMPIVNYSR